MRETEIQFIFKEETNRKTSLNSAKEDHTLVNIFDLIDFGTSLTDNAKPQLSSFFQFVHLILKHPSVQ